MIWATTYISPHCQPIVFHFSDTHKWRCLPTYIIYSTYKYRCRCHFYTIADSPMECQFSRTRVCTEPVHKCIVCTYNTFGHTRRILPMLERACQLRGNEVYDWITRGCITIELRLLVRYRVGGRGWRQHLQTASTGIHPRPFSLITYTHTHTFTDSLCLSLSYLLHLLSSALVSLYSSRSPFNAPLHIVTWEMVEPKRASN